MIRPWVANAVLLLAALAWVTNFVLAAVRRDYVINESVNSVFLAIVTGVLAARIRKDGKDDDDDEGGPEDTGKEAGHGS